MAIDPTYRRPCTHAGAPPDDVRDALEEWRHRSAAVAAERNPLVIGAVLDTGLTKEEVHVLTGLGRNTIDRILARATDG